MKDNYIKLKDCQRHQFVIRQLISAFNALDVIDKKFVIDSTCYQILTIDLNSLNFIAIDATSCEPPLYPLMYYYYLCSTGLSNKIDVLKPMIEGDFTFYNKNDGGKYRASFHVKDYTIDIEKEQLVFSDIEYTNCQRV